MNLEQAIEKFNGHKRDCRFKIQDRQIVFYEVSQKAKWTPRGFSTNFVEEELAKFEMSDVGLEIPKDFDVPNLEIVRSIRQFTRGQGILKEYETRYSTLGDVSELAFLLVSRLVVELERLEDDNFQFFRLLSLEI